MVSSAPTSPSARGSARRQDSGGQLLKELEALSQALYNAGHQDPSPRKELPSPYTGSRAEPASPYLRGREEPPSPNLRGREEPSSPHLGKREESPSPYLGRNEEPPSSYLGRTDASSLYSQRKEAQSLYLPKNEVTSPRLAKNATIPARSVSESCDRPGSLTLHSLLSSDVRSRDPRPLSPTRTSSPPTDSGKKTAVYRLDVQRAESLSPRLRKVDGALQPWHSQGFEKNFPEVTNLPAWLEDNLKQSQKLEAPEEKKSFWNWKPFRAIAHIGQQRFSCLFTVHVHGIEGLPSAMNGLRLTVHWQRKESSAHTMPSRVFQGAAEFEETLNLKCTVYGSKSGSHAVKYMTKNFDLSVVAPDVNELVLGKHRLDLSRLLPESLDDKCDNEKQSSWRTSFKLSGKAKGGTLVVTFGYQIVNKEIDQSSTAVASFRESPNLKSLRSYSLPHSPQRVPPPRPSDVQLSPTISAPADLAEYLGMENLSLDDSVIPDGPNTWGRNAQTELMRSEFRTFPRGEPKISLFPQDDSMLAPPTPRQSEEETFDLIKESSDEHQSEDAHASSEDEAEFTVIDQGVEMGTLSHSLSTQGYEEETAVDEQQLDGRDDVGMQEEEEEVEDSATLDLEVIEHLSLEGESLAEGEETDRGDVELGYEEKRRSTEVPSDGESEMQDLLDAIDVQDCQLLGEQEEEGTAQVEGNNGGNNEEAGYICQVWAADSPYCFMRKDSDSNDEEKESFDLAEEGLIENREAFEHLIETELLAARQEEKRSETGDSDDEIDIVAGEFLNLLESERDPIGGSSDSEADSPRALLLKQFEQEALIEGGVGLGFNLPELHDPTLHDMLDEPHEQVGPMKDHESMHEASLSDDLSTPGWGSEEDIELASIMEAAESELQKATQTMRSKTRAKLLEDAETEALMQEWGLNAKVFEGSPPKSPPLHDYDSPYSSALVHMPQLPPLGKGVGPIVQTRDGGSLRSMSPMHFQASSMSAQLVMQVSKPLVVPVGMGSSSMDILRHMAAAGMEGMAVQAMMAMPLEDIMGKSVEQIASEGIAALEGGNHQHGNFRNGYAALGPGGSGEAGWSQGDGVYSEGPLAKRSSSGMAVNSRTGSSMRNGSFARKADDFMCLEDLAPMAMQKIEALAMEGLKIQADMAEDEAPYSVDALSWREVAALEGGSRKKRGGLGKLEGVSALQLLEGRNTGEEASCSSEDGLMSMAISLDEWMRLDAGVYDESQDNENTKAILAAHHATHKDVVVVGKQHNNDKAGWGRPGGKGGASDMGGGFMGDTLTLAMLVQLRDPLRNYEPVGAPMMAMVQAERVLMPPRPKLGKRISIKGNSEEADEPEAPPQAPQFKIVEVTMSGLKADENTSEKKGEWGNQKQQLSGSRWLVANGMGKSAKHPVLKSKVPPVKTKAQKGESLWSITGSARGSGSKWHNHHTRNPDVTFGDTSSRRR